MVPFGSPKLLEIMAFSITFNCVIHYDDHYDTREPSHDVCYDITYWPPELVTMSLIPVQRST
jgi:hypothetical protein